MKKLLLVSLVLLGFKGFTQNQDSDFTESEIKESSLICVDVDEFTDEKSIRGSKETSVIFYEDNGDMQTEGLLIITSFKEERKGRLSMDLILKVYGMKGCIDRGSTLDVIFENGEKTQLVNWNDFDCDGTNYMRFNKGQTELFKNSKIKAIKYTNKRDYNSMIVKDNMNDGVNSVLMEVINEMDKLNNGELTLGKCSDE